MFLVLQRGPERTRIQLHSTVPRCSQRTRTPPRPHTVPQVHCTRPPSGPLPGLSLAAARASCDEAVDAASLYSLLRSVGLEYGPRYRTLELAAVSRAAGAAVGRLCRRSRKEGTRVHPADLDSGMQLHAISRGAEQSVVRLPCAVGAARLIATSSALIVVAVRKDDGMSLRLAGSRGSVAATADDVEVRSLSEHCRGDIGLVLSEYLSANAGRAAMTSAEGLVQAGLPLGALQYFDGSAAFRLPEAMPRSMDPAWEAPPATPPLPIRLDVIVVGAGVTGLTVASMFKSEGKTVAVLEKERAIGGVWARYANATSRLNSSGPSYFAGDWLRDGGSASDMHPSRERILGDAIETAAGHLHGCVFCGVEVLNVIEAEGDDVQQVRFRLDGAESQVVSAGLVVLCVNRRLGRPRIFALPGEASFAGVVTTSTGSDMNRDVPSFRGRHVVVQGMGAFAMECARTAIEGGAQHVTVVCRRHGTVSIRALDYLQFLRPFAEDGSHEASGSAALFAVWRKLYQASGATVPECWTDGSGLLTHAGHTISVSDIWFVAHHYGIASSVAGEIDRLEETEVVLTDGRRIVADVVVNATGFHPTDAAERLSGESTMLPNGLVRRGLACIAEPILRSGALANSVNGSSALDGVRLQVRFLTALLGQPGAVEACLADEELCQRRVRLSEATSSDLMAGQARLLQLFPWAAGLVAEHIETRSQTFLRARSHAEYFAEQQIAWTGLCTLCERLLGEQGLPVPARLPYPLARLPVTIAKELYGARYDAMASDLLEALPAALSRSRTVQPTSGEEAASAAGGGDRSTRLRQLTLPERQREVETVVLETVVLELAREAISAEADEDTALLEAGLDSLGAIELLSGMGKETGLDVSPSLLAEHTTPRQLVQALLAELQGASLPPAPRPLREGGSLHGPPQLQRLIQGEPRLLLLRRGGEEEPLYAMLPSNFGTVRDKGRLARALPAEVWGIEHGFLATGNPAYLGATRLEEQAAEYAELLLKAARARGRDRIHLFGGSFDALMAHKVAVALRAAGAEPGQLFLIDPPPPGPCCAEMVEGCSEVFVAAWAVRAGRVAAGHAGTDIESILQLFRGCEDLTDCALVAALELERLSGQRTGGDSVSAEVVRHTRRRIQIFRHHMQLWHAQEPQPQPISSGLVVVVSTLRWRFAFFGPASGGDEAACHASRLQAYGEHTVAVERDLEHAELYFGILAARDGEVVRLLTSVA